MKPQTAGPDVEQAHPTAGAGRTLLQRSRATKAAFAVRAVALLWAGVWVAGACSRTSLQSFEAEANAGVGASCVKLTCADRHLECGVVPDGCGGNLFCGSCSTPKVCGGDGVPNMCSCPRTTCAQSAADCGDLFDGCDGVLDCGSCPFGEICGGAGPNKCGATPCTAQSCAQLGLECGKASDGCAKVLDCGGCTAPNTCGGGQIAQRCGCTRVTCAEIGAACGPIADGCGGRLDCGSCKAPETCGVGGPNRCGCVPRTCAEIDAHCGTMLDGCGGTLECGTCSGRRRNRAKVCIGIGPANCSEEGESCSPTSCARLSARCGKVADGCGGLLECGTCAGPMTCGGGGVPNQCGCAPTTCDALSGACGTVADGCGALLDCGPCPTGAPPDVR